MTCTFFAGQQRDRRDSAGERNRGNLSKQKGLLPHRRGPGRRKDPPRRQRHEDRSGIRHDKTDRLARFISYTNYAAFQIILNLVWIFQMFSLFCKS